MVRSGIPALAACAALGACAPAQTLPAAGPDPLTSSNSFPFVMPWDASPTGTAMDMSFLNKAPAGANGRIIVKDGHFVESKTGARIRFFGTNAAARAAFPRLEDAEGVARRMKMLGINVVRFHHINNGWDQEGSVWRPGRAYIEMDPKQLQKMDNFVAALKKNGIYSNINLQTAREYLPELGLPETSRTLKNFGKKVDKFFPRMIELQKEYAKGLLDRVNPYTGLRYRDDPAILTIEINNENSLVGWPGESPGAGLSALPSPFHETIERMWNQWLVRKYGGDAGLRKAWAGKDTLTGASATTSATKWTWENQSGGDVTFEEAPGTGDAGHAATFSLTVRENKGPDWHIQTHIGGLTLANNKTYTVQFRAKADKPLSVGISARLDQPDWRMIGLESTVPVSTEWKDYSLSFGVANSVPGHSRIGFVLGGIRGKIEVAGFSVREGSRSLGLQPGESAERGTIVLPATEASQRTKDYISFLAETEAAYVRSMRGYLVNTLGFGKTFIIDSQTSWGGLTSFLREKESPFRDDHAYWNHPVFLGSDWDPVNYRVDRKALVNDLVGSGSTLAGLAKQRVEGKPHSVSEYNHPAPSDNQVEMMPLYSVFGAFQDWDILYTFAWDATGTGVDNTKYVNYFDTSLNPAKYAFYPMTALIFRLGLTSPAGQSVTLGVGGKPWLNHLHAWEAWGATSVNPLLARVSMTDQRPPGVYVQGKGDNKAFQTFGPAGAKVAKSDSPGCKVAVGFTAGAMVSYSGAKLQFAKNGPAFSAVAITAADGLPLSKSARILVTSGARFENQGMKWNESRTSVSDMWGQGPTMAEILPFKLTLDVNGPRKAYAIGPDGKRGALIPSSLKGGQLSLDLGPKNKSVWVEIVK